MPNDQSLDFHLKEAKQLEKNYDWLNAAHAYAKASEIALKKKDLLKAALLFEKIGFSFYRSALQAETKTEFKKRMNQAIKTYDRECELLKKVTKTGIKHMINHAMGLAAFARHWLNKHS